MTSDDGLTFAVTNSVPAVSSPVDRAGGIGLDNVRKRLQLLYPDRHQLTVKKEPARFTASLQITLT